MSQSSTLRSQRQQQHNTCSPQGVCRGVHVCVCICGWVDTWVGREMCLSVLCYIRTCFQYQCCICTHLHTYTHTYCLCTVRMYIPTYVHLYIYLPMYMRRRHSVNWPVGPKKFFFTLAPPLLQPFLHSRGCAQWGKAHDCHADSPRAPCAAGSETGLQEEGGASCATHKEGKEGAYTSIHSSFSSSSSPPPPPPPPPTPHPLPPTPPPPPSCLYC